MTIVICEFGVRTISKFYRCSSLFPISGPIVMINKTLINFFVGRTVCTRTLQLPLKCDISRIQCFLSCQKRCLWADSVVVVIVWLFSGFVVWTFFPFPISIKSRYMLDSVAFMQCSSCVWWHIFCTHQWFIWRHSCCIWIICLRYIANNQCIE